jgi:membrane associated rhomboid family serine protease
VSDTTVGTDPSVCYRHPGRQSWVLCQRCGRTVCPECQILAPVGVHCPECVREVAGGVTWRPVNAVVTPMKPKRRRATARVRSLVDSTGGLDAPKVVVGAATALFVVGSFSPLPFLALAALPSSSGVPFAELQVWRYVTAPFVSSAGGFSAMSLISFGLSALFFWLTAPQLERAIGRTRFIAVFAVSSIVGNAAMLLSGSVGYGLSTVLFGVFAALLVVVWEDQRVRVQILIMIGINLLLTLALGAYGLPALVGGMIGGAGDLYLMRVALDKGWKPQTAGLIIGAGCAVLILLAVVRGLT